MIKVVFAAITCLSPALSWAQTPILESPEALKAQLRLDAQAAGVPAASLERKVDEGLAKGVPLARIRPVLDKMLARLSRGRQLCAGFTLSQVCTQALADALQVGLSADNLKRILADPALGDEKARLRVIFTVSDLHARGVEAERSLPVVKRLVQPGGTSIPEMVRVALGQLGGAGNALSVPDREGNFRAVKGRADPRGRALGRNRQDKPGNSRGQSGSPSPKKDD